MPCPKWISKSKFVLSIKSEVVIEEKKFDWQGEEIKETKDLECDQNNINLNKP